MKIEMNKKSVKLPTFDCVPVGYVFLANGRVMMKFDCEIVSEDGTHYNVVNLETGSLDCILDDEYVEPLHDAVLKTGV